MNILVINCGSSTLKFQIIEITKESAEKDSDIMKVKGSIERIGGQAIVNITVTGKDTFKDVLPIKNHSIAVEYILKFIVNKSPGIDYIHSIKDIHAVGHRVVHGGEKFVNSVVLNQEIIASIEECVELAPLHNPANLKGIYATLAALGKEVPNVAVFDTAFHTSIPEVNYLYAVPYQYYRRHRIRKYGFHGTSHRYVADKYRSENKIQKNDVNIITLHLGNGCSACAIKEGLSFNTSMGFTPVSGLVMGSRCGDIDHSIIEYLSHKEGMSLDEINALLNKTSGLIGISGLTNDMRDLLDEKNIHNDRRSKLALDLFCSRIKHYIGAYIAQMNGADAIVFTGGVGENSPQVREQICSGLSYFGINIHPEKNTKAVGGQLLDISADDAKIKTWIIPTNEELLIAKDTFYALNA